MGCPWSKKELLPEIEAVRKNAQMDHGSQVQNATSDGARIANEVEEQVTDCRIVECVPGWHPVVARKTMRQRGRNAAQKQQRTECHHWALDSFPCSGEPNFALNNSQSAAHHQPVHAHMEHVGIQIPMIPELVRNDAHHRTSRDEGKSKSKSAPSTEEHKRRRPEKVELLLNRKRPAMAGVPITRKHVVAYKKQRT